MSLIDAVYATVVRELPVVLRQAAQYAHDPLEVVLGPRCGVSRRAVHLKPVVLVHGFCSVTSHLNVWARTLGESAAPYGVGYASLGHSIDETADCLAEQIRCIATWHNQRVSVVGHSLGGVLLRDAISRGKLAPYVDACVTVCSPHQGSRWADILHRTHMLPAGRSLRETTTSLHLEDQSASGASSVRLVTVAAENDLVVPCASALLHGAEHVVLEGVGHLSAISHPETLRVVAALA